MPYRNSMNFEEAQKWHREFVVKMGWDNSKTPLESVALIGEEIGELAVELDGLNAVKIAGLMKTFSQLTHELRRNKFDPAKTGNELADVILRVLDLAGELDIDIGGAVFDKISLNHENIEAIKAKGRRV